MCSVKKHIIFLLLMVCAYQLKAQNDSVFNAGKISSFQLYNNSQQKDIKLALSSADYSLFVFLSPECPLCQNYSNVLNGLYKKFEGSINMYSIIPGNAYNQKDVNTFASTYHIQFPLLTDATKKLSDYLKASITPEAILVDSKGQLIYKGAVDNLLEGLGKRRIKATSNYLEDAITAAINHQPITIKRTKAIGCKINNY